MYIQILFWLTSALNSEMFAEHRKRLVKFKTKFEKILQFITVT